MKQRFSNALALIAQQGRQRHQQGGVMVIGAAMLLVILLMGMLLWGISWKVQQRQRLQSALINSTRVAAQRWDYSGFAQGTPALQADYKLIHEAKKVLAANLAEVPGLQGSPNEIAGTASWHVVRAGGSCGDTQLTTTGICGAITITVQSLPLGLAGTYQLTATTIATIDTR